MGTARRVRSPLEGEVTQCQLEMEVVPGVVMINRGYRLARRHPVADILGTGDDVDVLGGEGSAVVVVGDGELG